MLLKAYEDACKYSREIMEKRADASIERMIRKDKITFVRAPLDEFWEKAKPILKNWETKKKYGLIPGVIDFIDSL